MSFKNASKINHLSHGYAINAFISKLYTRTLRSKIVQTEPRNIEHPITVNIDDYNHQISNSCIHERATYNDFEVKSRSSSVNLEPITSDDDILPADTMHSISDYSDTRLK